MTPPFSYRNRLLVEAKFYKEGSKVGLPIVRNTIGILKDVNEYWNTHSNIAKTVDCLRTRKINHSGRFHYQYAIFSATGYEKTAQNFAFTHDIFLIPLARSKFIRPLLSVIREVNKENFKLGTESESISVGGSLKLKHLRIYTRRKLEGRYKRSTANNDFRINDINTTLIKIINKMHDACSKLEYALLARAVGQHLFLLVPSDRTKISELGEIEKVKIIRDSEGEGWLLKNDRLRFSFDFPEELLAHYDRHKVKEKFLQEMQAVYVIKDKKYPEKDFKIKVVRFILDSDWLDNLR